MEITVLYLRSILPSVINCDLTVANIISTIYADRPCNAKSHFSDFLMGAPVVGSSNLSIFPLILIMIYF